MRAALAEGRYVSPTEVRVGFATFTDRYLARHPWRQSTTRAATFSLAHAVDAWGERPLSSIPRSEVQALMNGLDLAPSTKRIVLQHLRALFTMAVDDQLLSRSPARGIKIARPAAFEIVAPTVEQVAALHDSAPGIFRVAVALGAGLGLRQSEARGLTMDRVAFLRREVTVDRQATPDASGWAPTKTERSNRIVPAADAILAELAVHVERHGHGPHGHLLHRDGQALNFNAFASLWRKTKAAAGVDVRFHDLRHHLASELLADGRSLVAVARVLGDTEVTVLKTYGHLVEGDDERVRSAVERLWTRSANAPECRLSAGAATGAARAEHHPSSNA
jgi:integrase